MYIDGSHIICELGLEKPRYLQKVYKIYASVKWSRLMYADLYTCMSHPVTGIMHLYTFIHNWTLQDDANKTTRLSHNACMI